MATPEEMWQCQTTNCGYIYNPDKGDRKGKIPKGTRFEDLPEDWKCPVCGASKKAFKSLGGPGQRHKGAKSDGDLKMPDKKWRKIHMYKCPCGYGYEPEKRDREAYISQGWLDSLS